MSPFLVSNPLSGIFPSILLNTLSPWNPSTSITHFSNSFHFLSGMSTIASILAWLPSWKRMCSPLLNSWSFSGVTFVSVSSLLIELFRSSPFSCFSTCCKFSDSFPIFWQPVKNSNITIIPNTFFPIYPLFSKFRSFSSVTRSIAKFFSIVNGSGISCSIWDNQYR